MIIIVRVSLEELDILCMEAHNNCGGFMRDRRDFLKVMLGGAVAATAVPVSGAVHEDSESSGIGRQSLRIVHIGDPQFGFCDNGWPERSFDKFKENYALDLAAFERVAETVDRSGCDLVLISGDMTQNPEHVTREWPELIKRFRVPVVVTPGNHDMGGKVRKKNVERFNSVFGRDYRAFDIKGWRIIAGNTQYWHDTADAEGERAKYEEWVRSELSNAAKYNGKVVLMGHIPPFAYRFNEGSNHENYPHEGRKERLEMYLKAGAMFYLSGHMHRLCTRGYKDLTVLSAEATCFNYDCRPLGFRVFDVRDNFSYSWDFVKV